MDCFKLLYRYFLQISDYLSYKISSKRDKIIVILTFDDEVSKESIRIPRFLNKENISATFFVPPAITKDRIIEEIVSLDHEIGGHGYNHSEVEAKENYEKSALTCFNHLKKFYPPLISWRFPGLRGTKEAYINVKNAGFKIDSSKSIYYPFQYPKMFREFIECPFLRISPRSQMDSGVKSYEFLKRRILNVVSSQRGFLILPFHTNYQNKHFKEFKGLIKKLKGKKVIFKKLRSISTICYKEFSSIGTIFFDHR